MDVKYKGHLIMASAVHSKEKGWLPILYVTDLKGEGLYQKSKIEKLKE